MTGTHRHRHPARSAWPRPTLIVVVLVMIAATGCVGGGGATDVVTNMPLPSKPLATKLALVLPPTLVASSRIVFPRQPTFQLLDADGRSVSQSGVVVQATVTAGGGVVFGSGTATTNTAGTAAFTDL